MPKSRARKKPKKATPARRRPGGLPGPAIRMGMDEVLTGIMGAPPLLAPVFALMSVWMWNAAEECSPAGACVDAGIIFTGALAQFGIEGRLEPVRVAIYGAHGQASAWYGTNPRWNPDGTFNGHAVVALPGIGRFADATIQQFQEVPRSRLARLPLIAPMPAGDHLGTEPFPVLRTDHTVVYQGFPGNHQYLWRRPPIQARWADYQHAAANLAANVFDILSKEPLAARIRQAPYPRLHQLLDELDGSESLVQDGTYLFRHPAAGRLIQLVDIPFPEGTSHP
jgi:hypothetical protein